MIAGIIFIFLALFAFFIILQIRYYIMCNRDRTMDSAESDAPVVVTSQSHAPQAVPGYYPPMAPGSAPQGGIVYPPPGQYPQHAPYPPPVQPMQPPQQPYPVHQNAPVIGVQPPTGYNQDPPSYDQVQQDNTIYSKQPPYNPNYTGQ